MTASERRIAPEFPDGIYAWPELAKAVANAQRLEREFQEAAAAQRAMKNVLEKAVADDRARLAEAKLRGSFLRRGQSAMPGRKPSASEPPLTMRVVVLLRSSWRPSNSTELITHDSRRRPGEGSR